MKRRLNRIKRFRLRFEWEHADPWVTSETSTAELTVFFLCVCVCVCSPGSVLPDESTPAPVKAVRMVPPIHTGQRKRKHCVTQTVFVQGSAALVLQWSAASCWASSVSLCRAVSGCWRTGWVWTCRLHSEERYAHMLGHTPKPGHTHIEVKKLICKIWLSGTDFFCGGGLYLSIINNTFLVFRNNNI